MNHEFTGIVAVVTATAVEACAQLCLKIGAAGGSGFLPTSWRQRARLFPFTTTPAGWYLFGFLAYVIEIGLYTFALRFLDVSVAFPLGSLCFVGVALLSRIVLAEAVGRTRWLGIALILAGTVFVAL